MPALLQLPPPHRSRFLFLRNLFLSLTVFLLAGGLTYRAFSPSLAPLSSEEPPVTETSAPPEPAVNTFSGTVLRLFPEKENLTFDLFNYSEKVLRRFTLPQAFLVENIYPPNWQKEKESTPTAEAATLEIGDSLEVFFAIAGGGEQVGTIKRRVRANPGGVIYGRVNEVSSRAMMVESFGQLFRVRVGEGLKIGPRYRRVVDTDGKIMVLPGSAKREDSFSSVNVNDIVEIYYRENEEEEIIAQSVLFSASND